MSLLSVTFGQLTPNWRPVDAQSTTSWGNTCVHTLVQKCANLVYQKTCCNCYVNIYHVLRTKSASVRTKRVLQNNILIFSHDDPPDFGVECHILYIRSVFRGLIHMLDCCARFKSWSTCSEPVVAKLSTALRLVSLPHFNFASSVE